MDDFKDSKTSLIADVDCTTEGKDLCEQHKVQGYPSIKYGDPNDLKDYNGGRSYEDLKKFADENLGPSCGPDNLDLCNDEDKAAIEKFKAMDDAELDKAIEEADAKIAKVTEKAQKKVSKLEAEMGLAQEEVEAKKKKKDDAVAKEKKKLSIGVMKSVASAKKKADDSSSKKKKKKGKK